MVIAGTLSNTNLQSQTIAPYRFPGPVDVYQFAAPTTAIADATDVQLSDQVAPVNRPLYFVATVQIVTAYSNGDGAAPGIALKGSLNGSVNVVAAGDAVGTIKRFQGVLSPNEKLLFTPTAGTGTTEAGTAKVSVVIMDPTKGGFN